MDPIEKAIQTALLPIPQMALEQEWKSDSQWSVAVKKAIADVGRAFGWLTAANGCETDEGKEWLYDVVWYQSDKSGHMTDVPLVAESEWGNENAIKEDFEKLLVSRSRYRIMVFQAESEQVIDALLGKMELWISKFCRTKEGDRYLLVGWAWKSNKWVFKRHTA